uniref:Reverse transcriptase domain-containing protein n=1 Tax=Pygocentrus nattereri TaxID=42514 RepID=A0AAR2J957_PYGNA
MDIECIGLNVSLSPEMSFIVICLYRPPSSNSLFYEHLYSILKECDEKKELILMGDFNINWENKQDRKRLKEITDKFSLTQLVQGPTRVTKCSQTQIDLMFTNRQERITKSSNLLTGLSDHNFILVVRKLTKKRFKNIIKPKHYYQKIPKSEMHNLENALKQIDWPNILSCKDIDDNCDIFLSTINKVMSSFTRKVQSKPRQRETLPWLNDALLQQMKERDFALKRTLKTGLNNDRLIFTSLRNKVVRNIRKAKAEFFIKIIDNARGNGKMIWQNLNKLTGRNNDQRTKEYELKVNGTLIQDHDMIANTFNNFFINSIEQLTQSFSSKTIISTIIDDDIPIFRIMETTESAVLNIINSLRDSKAKDVYGLDTTFLKLHKGILASPIAKLINHSIRQGIFPSAWKSAVITPIFKAGDRTVVENYRPISILPAVSKVAEKWVVQQLTAHLNKSYTPLHSMQFGFRSNHSTETAICYFLEGVKSKLDKGGVIGAVFLDLKRAFDTVNHKVLLSKLSCFNFSIDSVKWMNSYISNRKQRVRIGKTQSTYLSCNTGVPQGSVLGPILFSLYINDLPSVCSSVNIQMYADDTVLYVHAKNKQQAASELTAAMVLISDWLSNSCLYLNINKTVCMFFSQKLTEMIQADVLVRGEKLKLVSDTKYLGIILDSNLSFKNQVKKVINTVKLNLANFRHIRPYLTTEAAKLFMHAMIVSHITYCFTSWSQTSLSILKPIESLYKQALKILDRKPNSYHHCHIVQKYNLLSFDSFKHLLDACLMFKILYGLAPPPLRQFIKQKDSRGSMVTRAFTRGDCIVQYRRSKFGQTVFSIRASQYWNSLPTELRTCTNYLIFKYKLKTWLKANQICNHR